MQIRSSTIIIENINKKKSKKDVKKFIEEILGDFKKQLDKKVET